MKTPFCFAMGEAMREIACCNGSVTICFDNGGKRRASGSL
jgi:hypothetical protein